MKQTLVLLHGWGFHSGVWEPFLPYLENHFTIIALDLLGFGENTDTSENLTLDSLTKNVLENTPPSAIFLGWSLGGLVAMNIAIHHPKRITQLIALTSTPKFVAHQDWPGMSPKVLNQFYEALKNDYQATLQLFILLQSPDRSTIRLLKKQAEKSKPPSERALNEGLHILKETDLREKLQKTQCPQLYLFGRCDTLVPPAVAEKLSALTGYAKTDIAPKAGHAPFLSDPEWCAEKIKAFLL